ncbi:MAG: hypothetical protein D6731_00260 [Planctomycetota bacterium]|nr:MAG: hypothetical protein D6731_00260 [Planctomycetota bacterium]
MSERLSARERRLAVATLAVVLLAGFVSLFVEPAWRRWTLASGQLAALEEANRRARAQGERLPALREELFRLEEGLLPPAGVTLQAWILRHLESLGAEAEFEPSSLRYLRADPLGESPYAELRFDLRARASAEQLQEFLLRLAASPRQVRVASLKLTPSARDPEVLDVALTLVALAPQVALDD